MIIYSTLVFVCLIRPCRWEIFRNMLAYPKGHLNFNESIVPVLSSIGGLFYLPCSRHPCWIIGPIELRKVQFCVPRHLLINQFVCMQIKVTIWSTDAASHWKINCPPANEGLKIKFLVFLTWSSGSEVEWINICNVHVYYL